MSFVLGFQNYVLFFPQQIMCYFLQMMLQKSRIMHRLHNIVQDCQAKKLNVSIY